MSENIANIFLEQYYGIMRMNREGRQGLINFYNNASQMTYTGSSYRGLKDISEKIESFGFETIAYNNMSSDVQEGPVPGSMLVFVNGYLQMDGSDQFRFAQVFNICPNGSGGYYIHNDIFTTIL
jgi:hypothetical protein